MVIVLTVPCMVTVALMVMVLCTVTMIPWSHSAMHGEGLATFTVPFTVRMLHSSAFMPTTHRTTKTSTVVVVITAHRIMVPFTVAMMSTAPAILTAHRSAKMVTVTVPFMVLFMVTIPSMVICGNHSSLPQPR